MQNCSTIHSTHSRFVQMKKRQENKDKQQVLAKTRNKGNTYRAHGNSVNREAHFKNRQPLMMNLHRLYIMTQKFHFF